MLKKQQINNYMGYQYGSGKLIFLLFWCVIRKRLL